MTSPGTIRTVLGDLDVASAAGLRWDYHEHLFQASRLLPGEEIDDADRSREEAALLATAGITGMIEATPIGLGRRPAAVAAISAATGLTVVHVTGAHRAEHYAPDHPILAESAATLANAFVEEIERGIPAVDSDRSAGPALGPSRVPVRAGMVKTGIGYWRIAPFERRVLSAAGAAHRRSGVAVMVHLEHGSAAHEVLDLLDAEGVVASRVVLAHVDRNLDAGLHIELAQRGAHLGYDGMARHQKAPDSAILDCLAAVVAAGHGDRILLGGDVARRSRYISYGGMPGLAYLATRFLPRLVGRIGRDAVDEVVRVNPLRLLTLGVDPVPTQSPMPAPSSLTARLRTPDQRSPAPAHEVPTSVELDGQRLIAIATVDAVEHAEPLGHCVQESGLRSIEITFRTEQAPEVLQRIRESTDLTVGAGTILTPSQVDRAIHAGAQFIVTPGFSPAVIERCLELGCPVVPGAATPSDVMAAFDAGLRVLKFFPAEALGGLRTLDALAGPFPQARFVPTGGITLESAPRYLRHPSVLAVGGSWMVAPRLLHAARWDDITRLCREAVGATTRPTEIPDPRGNGDVHDHPVRSTPSSNTTSST